MNKIYFFKVKEIVKGRYSVVRHYFRINGTNYEINEDNINMLKDNLEVPFFVETYALSRAEIGRIIMLLKEDNMIVNMRQTYKKNNEYYRFERAFIKAYHYFKSEQDGTVKIVKKYVDIDPERIRFEVYGGNSDSNPDPDKIATTQLKNQVVEAGYTKDYDIDKFYNTEIYQKALNSIINEFPDDAIYQSLKDHFDKYQ